MHEHSNSNATLYIVNPYSPSWSQRNTDKDRILSWNTECFIPFWRIMYIHTLGPDILYSLQRLVWKDTERPGTNKCCGIKLSTNTDTGERKWTVCVCVCIMCLHQSQSSEDRIRGRVGPLLQTGEMCNTQCVSPQDYISTLGLIDGKVSRVWGGQDDSRKTSLYRSTAPLKNVIKKLDMWFLLTLRNTVPHLAWGKQY